MKSTLRIAAAGACLSALALAATPVRAAFHRHPVWPDRHRPAIRQQRPGRPQQDGHQHGQPERFALGAPPRTWAAACPPSSRWKTASTPATARPCRATAVRSPGLCGPVQQGLGPLHAGPPQHADDRMDEQVQPIRQRQLSIKRPDPAFSDRSDNTAMYVGKFGPVSLARTTASAGTTTSPSATAAWAAWSAAACATNRAAWTPGCCTRQERRQAQDRRRQRQPRRPRDRRAVL